MAAWRSHADSTKFTTFISRFVAEHGYSPSFEEIGKGLDLNSLATVHKHISNLEKKGLLTRDYNRSRSIDLLPPKGRLKQAMSVNTGLVLPLVGRIAAGQPIEAVENPETISLADFVRSKDVFVLEVRGESMQDEHILDGDYVLVEKAKTAHNGDIVVALVDTSDATLKRFYREGDNIRYNLCRCTGYTKVERAIQLAAKALRNGETHEVELAAGRVGERTVRPDAKDKLLGSGEFVDDMQVPGMLHGAVLRAKYPRALVKKIDMAAARA